MSTKFMKLSDRAEDIEVKWTLFKAAIPAFATGSCQCKRLGVAGAYLFPIESIIIRNESVAFVKVHALAGLNEKEKPETARRTHNGQHCEWSTEQSLTQ
ncbi:unnamed protein product [Clavelina lepadiformis]|uniref:Uncharacterized protein n=1 Tax=Clavelina lepadiformis TaxID=159417 RepID=A0ABP0H1K4_CLALP